MTTEMSGRKKTMEPTAEMSRPCSRAVRLAGSPEEVAQAVENAAQGGYDKHVPPGNGGQQIDFGQGEGQHGRHAYGRRSQQKDSVDLPVNRAAVRAVTARTWPRRRGPRQGRGHGLFSNDSRSPRVARTTTDKKPQKNAGPFHQPVQAAFAGAPKDEFGEKYCEDRPGVVEHRRPRGR